MISLLSRRTNTPQQTQKREKKSRRIWGGKLGSRSELPRHIKFQPDVIKEEEDPEESARTIQTVETTGSDASNQATTITVGHDTPEMMIPIHHHHTMTRHIRHTTLTTEDFEGLLIRSRGWEYDCTLPPSEPHHRLRNSMASRDYDKYIFK